ncbi:MAG TPA: hypothetical protein VEA44_19075 [Caulobacter sp.]|nr:hypothetical protein [Caulobacter sp.]
MELTVINDPPPLAFLIGLTAVGVLVVLYAVLTALLMAQVHKVPGGMGLPRRIRWGIWQSENRGVTVGQLIWRAQFDPKRYPATAALQTTLRVIQIMVLLLFLAFMAWQGYLLYREQVG